MNRFFSLFIEARTPPSADRCAPSSQTTTLDASGTGAPFLINRTRPESVPAGGGEGESKPSRRTRKRIVQIGENHNIQVPSIRGKETADRSDCPPFAVR